VRHQNILQNISISPKKNGESCYGIIKVSFLSLENAIHSTSKKLKDSVKNIKYTRCKKYIGGANNLRDSDVIVMSSGVTKLFKFIIYFLLIQTSFYSICLTENNVLKCRFLLKNTVFIVYYNTIFNINIFNTPQIKLGYHN
jgi:hypothetical protein